MLLRISICPLTPRDHHHSHLAADCECSTAHNTREFNCHTCKAFPSNQHKHSRWASTYVIFVLKLPLIYAEKDIYTIQRFYVWGKTLPPVSTYMISFHSMIQIETNVIPGTVLSSWPKGEIKCPRPVQSKVGSCRVFARMRLLERKYIHSVCYKQWMDKKEQSHT